MNKSSEWIFYGILGTLSFGVFGFSVKFSTMEPYVSNFLMQLLSLAVSLFIYLAFLRKETIKFSKSGSIAGIFATTGTLILLYTVSINKLIVTYPFAAMAGLVFLLASLFYYKLKFRPRQIQVLLLGLAVSIFGLFLAVAGSAGGLVLLLSNIGGSFSFVSFGLGIMLFWGLCSFFWFKAIVKEKVNISSFLISMTASATVASFVGMLLLSSGLNLAVDSTLSFILIAGIFMGIGLYFISNGFKFSEPQSKAQSLILAILANGEIIPITILALLFLNEYSLEAIIGVASTIIGITLINYSESV